MRISAKADYAVRAAVELASTEGNEPVNAKMIALAHGIPLRFLETILSDLRNAGVVTSRRGFGGGYRLGRPAAEISVADVIRAVEGPVATVAGDALDEVGYAGSVASVRDVWVALRSIVESTTLEAVARGELPPAIAELAADGGLRTVGPR